MAKCGCNRDCIYAVDDRGPSAIFGAIGLLFFVGGGCVILNLLLQPQKATFFETIIGHLGVFLVLMGIIVGAIAYKTYRRVCKAMRLRARHPGIAAAHDRANGG